MADLVEVAYTGIKNLLSADSTLMSTINNAVIATQAPGGVDMPYVRMVYITGGEDNVAPRRSIDMIVRVTAVSQDGQQASNLSGRIADAITGNTPSLPDGWMANTRVTQLNPYDNPDVVQNWGYHEIGAHYRVRATKG